MRFIRGICRRCWICVVCARWGVGRIVSLPPAVLVGTHVASELSLYRRRRGGVRGAMFGEIGRPCSVLEEYMFNLSIEVSMKINMKSRRISKLSPTHVAVNMHIFPHHFRANGNR